MSYVGKHRQWWCDACQDYVAGPPPEPSAKPSNQPVFPQAAPPPKKESSALNISPLVAGAAIVVAIGVFSVVFCRDSDSKKDTTSPERSRPSTQPWMAPASSPAQVLYDERVEVAEEQYHAYAFEVKREASVTIELDGVFGPAFEFWTMARDGFHKFESAAKSLTGGRFDYITDLSKSDVHEYSGTSVMPKGRYYLVIDNSDSGKTKPPSNFNDDKLTVQVKISAGPVPQ